MSDARYEATPPYPGNSYPANNIEKLTRIDFKTSIAFFFKNYARFKGYSTRPEFWWPWLILFILGAGLTITTQITLATAAISGSNTQTGSLATTTETPTQFEFSGAAGTIIVVAGILSILVSAATVIPSLSVMWRRLHDTGLPGPTFFISLIPFVGGIILLILLARGSKPELRRPHWDA